MPHTGRRPTNDPILVVDDDAVLRTALARILRSEGHEVIEATTGPDALALIRNERPCLVVMDSMLQGMDGEMVMRTSQSEFGKRAPAFILLTTSPREAEQARDLGALLGLCKPFRVEDLLDIAEQFRAPIYDHDSESGVIRIVRPAQREFDLDGALLRAVADAG
ncbi:MAG: response regulator [Polyangiales bacterium]|nr:response regulator [Myxococcales bacterium]